MNIPVCVRDGCQTGVIEIGDFRFEIDLTELQAIIVDARLEMRDSCLPNAPLLSDVLHCMDQKLILEMKHTKSQTESEMAKNLKRWQETGCGGHTNLDEAWVALGKAGMDDWRPIWKKANKTEEV